MSDLDRPYRLFVATFPDGSQVLITEWSSGRQEAAKRGAQWETWGPPCPLEPAP